MTQVETDRIRVRRSEQREKILSAALSLFADGGYYNTGTAHVAFQSGCSEPAIYRHYENKEALAVAVVNRASEIFEEALRLELVGKDNKGARINALLDAERVFHAQPEGRVFYMLLSGAVSDQLRDSLWQFFEKKRDLYQQIAGDEFVAWKLFSVVSGVGMMAMIEGQEVFDATIDQLKKEFGNSSRPTI